MFKTATQNDALAYRRAVHSFATMLHIPDKTCCSGCRRNTVGSFSPLFLDRVYEEHVTSHKTSRARGYPNQMDFGAFLDFMLAWDNRSSMAGMRYLFPVFDLKGRGFLTQVLIALARKHMKSKTTPSDASLSFKKV